MILLVDAGNTRLKWARLAADAGGPHEVHAAQHRDVPAGDWQGALVATGGTPRRILVGNVAGPALAAELARFARAAWGVEPEFVAATRAAAGVVSAYARTDTLGVDRWLGMIAARHAAPTPCVVVNAGTAFTVDLVDGDGRHRGGCIVPGTRLMREALYARTSDVGAHAAQVGAAVVDGYGVSTAGCVEQGARLALAALADRAGRDLERLAGAPGRTLVTGGDAAELLPLLARSAEHVPDLVLRGLAVLAREGA